MATLLRLAHKACFSKGSIWLCAVLGLLFFSACTSHDRQVADKLNSLSYAYHYRNLDSVQHYATVAKGSAEALNNEAFVSLVRMDYRRAARQLDSVPLLTDNQLELLVSYVQHMRRCQRQSHNKAFHDYRERAFGCLQRINEERSQLNDHQRERLRYAETEFAIVNSTYYYYVGLESQSIEALQIIDPNDVRLDTAQYLNYLYNMGAGGFITEGSADDIWNEEVELLRRCLNIAERFNYPYFVAQAKEALADHTGDFTLAEEALETFQQYGDIYQIAGAHRTLATCYHTVGNDRQALYHLRQALADRRILQAPDLVASIREQLSVVYAALDDKVQSDHYRKLYLDVQEQTRQDRELEARAALLDKAVGQLNGMVLAVVGAIVLLLVLVWLFNRMNRNTPLNQQLADSIDERREAVEEARMRLERSERQHEEQRAKISLALSILPLVDRIRYAVKHLASHEQPDNQDHQESLTYIRELTDSISEQNQLLTQWIQLRQGQLSLHIESFPVQGLFDILARSKTSFQLKQLTLQIDPTDAVVKADRVLTLFMLNTLADNARKFTPAGGTVTVRATTADDYVEVSVADTGCGIPEGQLAHLFDAKPVRDDAANHSHGFGLMNCRGIIEKYRKTSRMFNVCTLQAESEEGRGSRFFFRLPKGIRRTAVMLLLLLAPLATPAMTTQEVNEQLRQYNDSAVVALERHDWQTYARYNKMYMQLFKEMSADNTLTDYCRTMQQSQTNKRIAVILLLVVLASILPAYYLLYYRHRLYNSYLSEQQQLALLEQADEELRRAEMENARLHVVNSVLDNCLSTLKHETMYYPSRIRQLVDSGQIDQLQEVADYYRDLYAILIQQAMGQVESVRLHMKPVSLYGQMVLGDENLLRYLFELFKASDVTAEVSDEKYVRYHVAVDGPLSPVDSMIARQIVRDHGEATNRRGCGITVNTETIITLPKYHGTV